MKNKKGFTIVELIAVVMILGMISSIAIISVSRIRKRANDQEIESLRSSIVDSFNNYRMKESVKKGETVKIDELKFDKELSYNNNICTLDENDTIKYIVKGDYYDKITNDSERLKYGVCMTDTTVDGTQINTECTSEPSKAEAFCIKLSCNGTIVINDYEDTSSLCSFNQNN